MNNYINHIYSKRWALCAGCVDLYVYLVLKSETLAPKQHLDISIRELSKNLYTSANSIKKYRDKLVLAGLVSYDTGTPQQVCSTFTITPITASNFDVAIPATASNFDVAIPTTTSNFDVAIPTTTSNFDAVNKNSANILNETISKFDAVKNSSDFAIIWSNEKEKKQELAVAKAVAKASVKTTSKKMPKKMPKCGFLFVVAYPTVGDFILPIQRLSPMDIDEVSYWYNQAKAWSDENLAKKPNWDIAVSNWKTNNPYQYQEHLAKLAKQQNNDKTGLVAGSGANKELIMKLDFDVKDWQNKISKLKTEVQNLMSAYDKYPEDRESIKIELEKLSIRQKQLEYELGLAQIRRQKLD